MPRKKQNKKSIERYEHTDKRRVNNPPVGLVTPETDKELGKKTYAYDPHIDPALQFDSQRSKVERIIDDGLSAETLEQAKAALQELKKRQQPYLNWAGKAEGTTFEVPTVSLHVHERIDPRTIVEAVRKRNGDLAPQLSLFESPEENPPLRQAIEFYQHKHNWSNRLIAGDSLLLMNSLLEKEGLAGQVQMIYIDPPYGIKYGSNFQPFVNKRDVRHGNDEDLTAEPEMIKAFRDTWELGIHSYLTYLRDRLLLARELLADSGSVFVQISDENVQHVRELLDEVFGTSNFVGQISVKKSGMMVGGLFKSACYYLVWYAWEIEKVKFRKLFVDKEAGIGIGKLYDQIESPDSMSQRKMTLEEISNPDLIPKGWRPYQLITLTTGGFRENTTIEYEFEGKTYHPGPDKCWRTTREGLDRLQSLGRLQARGQLLYYKTYLDDFPAAEVTSLWSDIGSQGEKMVYAVQTPRRLIGRAILMTTDPGDLVFDPTCGSGTTAYVAEQWGRRWITCDTSRVAVTLAKQRLMTAVFDYYELAHPEEGVGSGFKYKTVPHITLKSIANNEPPAEETLYDQPFVDKSRTRVTGPFTVEAVPSPQVKPLSTLTGFETLSGLPEGEPAADATIARSGETLRQAEWRDELLRTGIRGKGGQMLQFSRVEPLSGTRWLHADGETIVDVMPAKAGIQEHGEAMDSCLRRHDKGESGNDNAGEKNDKAKGKNDKEGGIADVQRAVVSFGPEHAPLEQRQVALAIEEAQKLVPKPKIIVFAAFQFDPEAAKDIDEIDWPGVTLLKAQMNADLLTEDLK